MAFTILASVPGPGLLFGLMLAAAILGGYAARLAHVPRVVGFLLAGVALRQILHVVLGVSDDGVARQALQTASEPLQVVEDLALGLILFAIGGVFQRSKLRAAQARMMKISFLEISLVLLLVRLCFLGYSLPDSL